MSKDKEIADKAKASIEAEMKKAKIEIVSINTKEGGLNFDKIIETADDKILVVNMAKEFADSHPIITHKVQYFSTEEFMENF